MEGPPLPPKLPGRLHALSWWSLALMVMGVVLFTAGWVWAANAPKEANKAWVGDAWTVMIFILTPLCMVSSWITGIIGSVKRPGCFSIGIVVGPVVIVVVMVLFLWLVLEAVSAFR